MRPASLLLRTSFTLGVSALAIALVSILALDRFVTTPLAEQSADDEAALLVLTAQTWVELPPAARPYFELELVESHGLVISPEVRELDPLDVDRPWMGLLHTKLDERLERPVRLLEGDDLVWAEIPMGGFRLQVGFSPDRRGVEPLSVALVIFGAGAAIVLIASLLIVQRITRPLDAVAQSARRFRGGSVPEPLPETGPSELVTLARSFNTMASEISELISNRTTLLAGISHDLRTPLARMRLAVELLPEDTDPQLVARLSRNLEEMDALLSVTLQFARGLSGEDVTEVRLKGFIEEVLAHADLSGVSLRWHGDEDLRLADRSGCPAAGTHQPAGECCPLCRRRGAAGGRCASRPGPAAGPGPGPRRPGEPARAHLPAVLSAGGVAQPAHRRQRSGPGHRQAALRGTRLAHRGGAAGGWRCRLLPGPGPRPARRVNVGVRNTWLQSDRVRKSGRNRSGADFFSTVRYGAIRIGSSPWLK
ncbi:MAG: HAMP domain-containing protein [Gammaproteobacteria bacterium]|nr:HAMP domain-containing protein [Gammaproteobacteria bacterium]